MKENRKMKAGKVGGSSPSAEVAEARRGRWLKVARKEVSERRKNPNLIPAEWIEEIEGRPLEEVIVDRLARSRFDDSLWLQSDEKYERVGGRCLACHDRELVVSMIADFLYPRFNFAISRTAQRDFIRRFYEVGDFGMVDVERRALRFAAEAARHSSDVRPVKARRSGCVSKVGAVRLASFDAADRATLRKLAKNNGVSVGEVADRVGRIASGRRVSRRIDWRT